MRLLGWSGWLLSFAVLGCAGAQRHPEGPSFSPSTNLFVRNAFDTDPSSYLGRFVPNGQIDPDETSAMPLACSRFVTHRFVEAGDVRTTESMLVSSELAARLGVPVLASVRGSTEAQRAVRVEYTLRGKLVAEVHDPEGFARCCNEQPDQCTDRFIGEFLQGTGVVYREDGRRTAVEAQGTHPGSGVNGDAGLARERQWTQAIEFPNPVYFAFKITPTVHRRQSSSCGRWVDTPPAEPGYVFFVGNSRPARSEQVARTRAMWTAQHRAYASAADPAVLDDPEANNDPAAMRWAMGMEVIESCVELDDDGRKRRYVGRVLGRLPRYESRPKTDGESSSVPAELGPTPSGPES